MKKTLKLIFSAIGILLVVFVVYFFTIKKLDQKVLELEVFSSTNQSTAKAILVPTKFIEGERFYIKLPLSTGDTILAFGDTGGGNTMLLPNTVEKKKLQSLQHLGLLKGIMPMHYVLFNDIVKDANFPQPNTMRAFIIRTPFARVTAPCLVIPPMDDELKFFAKSIPQMEAFLAQNFFLGKSWTIDYPKQQIWVNTPLSASDTSGAIIQKIGLKRNSHNQAVFGHASMVMEVNGEKIDVLFDTGASFVLSESGKKQFNTTNLTLGGSFIAASIFEKWRKEHPEWKYYPKADWANDIIEVPFVKIGNCEVGPALFASRPDVNWSENMINSMDKVVKGAIGGSALKYVKVTVDFNSELIKFEK